MKSYAYVPAYVYVLCLSILADVSVSREYAGASEAGAHTESVHASREQQCLRRLVTYRSQAEGEKVTVL